MINRGSYSRACLKVFDAMTRMWGINPRYICDENLYGEHAEIHQLIGLIKKHRYGMAIVRGYVKKNQVNPHELWSRHEELAKEIERRGGNHDSDINMGTIEKLVFKAKVRANVYNHEEINMSPGEVELDTGEILFNRCEDCRNRLEKLTYREAA